MSIMKKIAVFLVAVFASVSLMAQTIEEERTWKMQADTVKSLKHYVGRDNWFIGVQGGANISLSENSRFGKNIDMTKPSFALQVGKYFSPAVGARIQMAYFKQESRANSEAIDAYPQVYGSGNYGFSNFGAYLDGLFNFNNIFGQYKESSRFNVVGILGGGLNHTFGFDDKVKAWDRPASETFAPYKVNTDKGSYVALHAGVQLNYAISQALDLNLEATFNGVDDGYNGTRYDKKWDAFANVMVGLTFHFKDHYGARRFRYTQLDDQALISELTRKIDDERNKKIPEPEPTVEVVIEKEVVQNQVLDMTVSFAIDKYNITDIQKKNVAEAAKYLEEHPDVNLIIIGYADVQTAYPAYNLKLSERRAKAVYNMMVKEFNVDPDRIRTDFKGDTIQPYERKNEWNRVVVFITEPRNKQ